MKAKSRQTAEWMEMSGAEFVRRQKRKPVLLTNQSTEAVGGSATAFKALGLPFAAYHADEFRDCGPSDRVPEGEKFYPLTSQEAQLVAEDGIAWDVPGYEGAAWHVGTSAMHKGKKWLNPILEIQHNEGPFTQNAGDPTPKETRRLARAVKASIESTVKKVGGSVYVEHDPKLATCVLLYLPMPWALEHLRTYEGVKRWLAALPRVKA